MMKTVEDVKGIQGSDLHFIYLSIEADTLY